MHDDLLVPVRYYLDVLKRQAWLIVLITVLTIGAAYWAASSQTKMYRAETILVLGQPETTLPGVPAPEREDAQTIAALFRSDAVAAGAIRRLRLDTTPKKLLKDFTATTTSGAVVEASYDAPDPDEAERVLRALSAALTGLLERRLDLSYEITVFNPPRADPDPVSPNVALALAFGGALGLALGLLAAVLRERLDDSIRNRRDAEESFGAPVIGALPKGWRQSPPTVFGKRGHALEKSIRILSSDLEPNEREGLAVVLTSMRPEEGKATIVANLGVTLARDGLDIVCVEADVQHPRLHKYLSVDRPGPGLIEVAQGVAEIEPALVGVPLEVPPAGKRSRNGASGSGSLRLLTIGGANGREVDALTETHVADLLKSLRARADVTILDVSPLGAREAFPFVRESDRTVLVARAGETTRTMAEGARAVLERLGARGVGVVLVDADARQLFF
jgi:succinoglycan biosynthesis transport protein ExoP